MCDYLAKKNFKCQYVQKISINYKIYGNNADEKCYENVTKDVFHKKTVLIDKINFINIIAKERKTLI